MRIGSLFSGIGGLELGLERAGVGHVVWQVEKDEFCRRVLAKRWPDVERFEDVTTKRIYPDVDLVCGGFPCQDVSSAGKRAGLQGQRSGLWFHFARIIEQVAPRWVVVENVASGKAKWLHVVRHHLHMLGYGTRALALSAAEVGAPHLRRRIFVVAHANSVYPHKQSGRGIRSRRADAVQPSRSGASRRTTSDPHGNSKPTLAEHGQVAELRSVAGVASAWAAAPVFSGVDDGLSRALDAHRNRALGNAVVPQCAEVIGQMIVEAS